MIHPSGCISQKFNSIVQFNVIQHKNDNTTESSSIGCGTTPGHLVIYMYCLTYTYKTPIDEIY